MRKSGPFFQMMLAMQRAPVYKEAYGGLQYKSIR